MSAAPPLAQNHRSPTAASPGRTGLLVGGVLLIVFSIGSLAGYVYAHEPSPPELRASLAPPALAPDTMLRGTLQVVTPDFIEVSTAAGAQRLAITSAVPVEEVTPL